MDSPLTSGDDFIRDSLPHVRCLCHVGTLPTDPVLSLPGRALPTWVLGDASLTVERSGLAERRERG